MFTPAVLRGGYGVVAITALQTRLGHWPARHWLGRVAAVIFSIPYLIMRA